MASFLERVQLQKLTAKSDAGEPQKSLAEEETGKEQHHHYGSYANEFHKPPEHNKYGAGYSYQNHARRESYER